MDFTDAAVVRTRRGARSSNQCDKTLEEVVSCRSWIRSTVHERQNRNINFPITLGVNAEQENIAKD